ncbi:hypothetical protein O1611_g6278 [Lasiodiplodia mahajangana]|uniref:Uncharacterized protein n=1 Tax=Lasiodiplodia mahajangana TaxID=1108764 RepID=A0ACC2JJH8_9PEZI|nr:hypothetical protein O1611_g6278 [Lasiodiplodia mahajangana]
MSEFLSALSYYGYDVPEIDYEEWKTQLEEFVLAGSVEKDQEQSALMPLFHMATSDLPSTTRAPELDDRNTMAILKGDADRWTGVDDSAGEGVMREDIGSRGRELPPISADIAQAQAQVGSGWSWWHHFIMFPALDDDDDNRCPRPSSCTFPT